MDPSIQVRLIRSDHHAEGGQVSVVTLPFAPLNEVVHLGVGGHVTWWVDPGGVTVVAIVEPPPTAP